MLKLDMVQNRVMGVILGITKDTSVDAMRYMLDLPHWATSQKMEQIKVYLSKLQNPSIRSTVLSKKTTSANRQQKVMESQNRTVSPAWVESD